MGQLLSIATKIENLSSLESSNGDFVDVLIDLAPEVNKFLKSCGPSETEAPPNPKMSPTDEEIKAWNDAWNLKEMSGKANTHHINVIARHIRKGKRKNGNPIKNHEAVSLAQALINNAQNQDLVEISEALLESRSN